MTKLTKHMKNRKVNTDLYPDCFFNEEEQSFTMLLWSLTGRLLGYQVYKPDKPKKGKKECPRESKYFTYVAKSASCHKTNELTAWGLTLLNRKRKYLFVCEGFADAARLHNLNLNCLALFSSVPKTFKSWLFSLGYEVVPVCEGDEAGLKLHTLSSHGDVVYLPENKDLSDLSDEELMFYFKDYLL